MFVVTSCHQLVQELLSQCGHYNDKVRRDAIAGLAELAQAHPAEARRHATQLMGAAAECIGDSDSRVRTALRDALSSAIFPALGAPALGPFVPLLMAHVGAALTHLADAIRADALAFLELLTQWRPDLVASMGLAQGLQHYAALLSRGSRGRSIKAGSLGSLAAIVASLERFLARTVGAAAGIASDIGHSKDSVPAAMGAAVEREHEEYLQRVLYWRRCAWPQLAAPGPMGQVATAAEGSSGGGMAGSREDTALGAPAAGGTGVQAAAVALLDHLVQCWTECAPGSLAELPDPVTAQCLAGILRCCELLAACWGLGTLGGDPAVRTSLSATLLAKVSPHFPATAPGGHLQSATAEALVSLNIAAAQLLCRFLPFSGQAEAGWAGRLLDWFAAVMHEGAALPAANDVLGGGQAPAANARRQRSGGLPTAVYRSALKGTASVLPLVSPPRRRALLAAAFVLWERSPLRSQARVLVLALWQRLLADPASAFYTPMGPAGEPLLLQEEAAAWLGALPKFIYQIGSGSKEGSGGAGAGADVAVKSALWLLLDAARCAPPGTPLAACLAGLAPQLAPLLAALLPPGGRAQGWRLVVGPLVRQPTHVQVSRVLGRMRLSALLQAWSLAWQCALGATSRHAGCFTCLSNRSVAAHPPCRSWPSTRSPACRSWASPCSRQRRCSASAMLTRCPPCCACWMPWASAQRSVPPTLPLCPGCC